jgi:acyl carrier protein
LCNRASKPKIRKLLFLNVIELRRTSRAKEHVVQTGADSMEGFVVATIAEFAHCRHDDVVRQASLIDLGVDSLAIATLATFVEAEYACTFTPEQLTTLYSATCIEDVLLAVRQVLGSAADCAAATAPRDGQAL